MKKLIKMTLVGGLALLSCIASAQRPLTAESQPASLEIKIGIQPWLGYGQWYIAQEKGFFTQHGLTKASLINFVEDKDVNAALASGQIDGANVATHTAMSMVSAGLPVKIVLLLDSSKTADAILVNSSIHSLEALKGQAIAYEEGTTSDILLRNALTEAGIKWHDINPVPMPAASAGSALITHNVPAAVTYEPYITMTKKQDPTLSVLYDGTHAPGLISDVLVVRSDVIQNDPGQVLALVKSWNDAVAYYKQHNQEGRTIIAHGIGEDPQAIQSAFEGVVYYNAHDNQVELKGEFKDKIFNQILHAATAADMIMQPVTFDQVIDPRFAALF